MNAPRLSDAQISRALRAHVPERAQAGLRERILEAAETTTQQRALPSFLGAISEADPITRRRSLLIAAALLVALAIASGAAVGALRILQRDPFSELTPLPTPDPMPTVRPSLGPRPSGPAGPLAWTEASLNEDWPAPVRPEPDGGAIVLPMPLTHIDLTGDTGSDIDPWVDIRAVMGGASAVQLKLVSNQPPVMDPTEQWIAYGVVIDDDRDGVPDWRYGIDNNMPAYASGEPGDRPVEGAPVDRTRVWRTNLHTGRTDDQGFLSEGYVGVWPNGADANFEFGGTADVAGRGAVTWGIELDMPFYAWASVIVNGRVVATDYAPDAGWLIATPNAKPGGTYLLEEPFPVRLAMTVADGWKVDQYGDSDAGGVSWVEGEIGVLFVIVDNPSNIGECDEPESTTDPPLGPSVDDLVTFLVDRPFIDMVKSTDVTLDGYRGKYLEYTKTAGETECVRGGMGGWLTSSRRDVDEYDQVWILDVDGVRLVIDAFSTSASETVRAELRKIVQSIQIEP